MKKAVLLLFCLVGIAFVPTMAQEQLVFEENFDANQRNWSQLNDEKLYAQVENGVYRMERREAEGSDQFLMGSLPFDSNRDFEISTTLTQTFGGQNDGFGLVWGARDQDNCHALIINSAEQYSILRYKDAKVSELKSFTSTQKILKPKGQPNRLTIRRVSEVISLYANGTFLHSIPVQTMAGKKAGFLLNNKMEITADQLTIRQNPPMAEIFVDAFDDEGAEWRVTSVDSQITIAKGGKLYMRPEEGKRATFLTREVILNTDRDFEVESILRSISGSQNRGYGIVWGGKGEDLGFIFVVNGFGSYAVFKRAGNETEKILDWTSSGQVLSLRMAPNKLMVRKSGDEVDFFLNDHWLARTPFEALPGNRVGFVLQGDLKLGIDHIVVREGERRMPIETEPVLTTVEGNKKPPVITLIQPTESEITVENKTLVFRAGISSEQKLTGIKLLVNDQQIPMQAKRDADGNYDLMIDQEIQLPKAENEIRLLAKNEDGLVQRQTVTVNVKEPEQPLVRNGNDYALFFATNEYDEWSPLTNPINDVRTMARELEANYGFNTELVLEASKSDILKKLKEYARREFGPNDQLMIFFAGHGKFDEDFGEGYVVCTNSRKNDEGNDSYIPHSSLRTIINNIPSRHTFLVMDVCFGGTIDPFIANSGNRGGRGDNVTAKITPTEFIERKLKFKTRKYLTSGGKEYVPDGNPGAHSPFTRKFLEALRDYGGQDHIITLAELLLYFERVAPEPRFGEFGRNEPGSDFLFISR